MKERRKEAWTAILGAEGGREVVNAVLGISDQRKEMGETLGTYELVEDEGMLYEELRE